MKPLTTCSAPKWLLLNLAILIFISCQKEKSQRAAEPLDSPAVNSGSNQTKGNSEKIYVNDVGQLYEALNNIDNAGKIIVLAAGTYILNASYPNAGRLELLENMELQGQAGHPEDVIIDASSLPGSSFVPPNNFPAPRTGAIRMGRGSNSIEWLTVKGNASMQALSVIDTDLIGLGVSQIRVAHCVVKGGRIGIDVRNINAASSGRVIEAELTNNEVLDNMVQQGQGIEIQNANGASRAIIRASLSGNYVHGNKVGLRSFNVAPNNSTINSGSISIESNADRFDENGIGIFLNAALAEGSTSIANGNSLVFEAHGTSIQNNIGAIPPEFTPSCGIFVAASNKLSSGESSNNRLKFNLWGCSISNNLGAADIIAFGAVSLTGSSVNINNVAEIELHGVSKQATDLSTASSPLEPAGTNTVKTLRN